MATTTGYYEIYSRDGQWRWRFKSNNHEIVGHGESYANKTDCMIAVGLMRSSFNAPIREI